MEFTGLTAFIITPMFFPISAVSADFDCSRARSPDEKVICSTPSLSEADKAIGNAYRRALSQGDKAKVTPIARQFLAKRGSCGADVGCIARVQKQMLDAYGAIADGMAVKATIDKAADTAADPDLTEGDGVHSVYYGTRAGMIVDIVGISGTDTAHAVLRFRHTRMNAMSFCREYAMKVTDKCINDEMKSIGSGAIMANCTTGEFTSLSRNRLIFQGFAPSGSNTTYLIRAADTGEILDGSMATGYPTFLGQFKVMCPARVPRKEE
jgi:uncharacterized protein